MDANYPLFAFSICASRSFRLVWDSWEHRLENSACFLDKAFLVFLRARTRNHIRGEIMREHGRVPLSPLKKHRVHLAPRGGTWQSSLMCIVFSETNQMSWQNLFLTLSNLRLPNLSKHEKDFHKKFVSLFLRIYTLNNHY